MNNMTRFAFILPMIIILFGGYGFADVLHDVSYVDIFAYGANSTSDDAGFELHSTSQSLQAQNAVTLDVDAFVDINNNGKRDAGEDSISDIPVLVYTPTTQVADLLLTGTNHLKTDLTPHTFYAIALPPPGFVATSQPFSFASNMYWGVIHIIDPLVGSSHEMDIGLLPVGSPTNIGDTKVGLLLPLTGSNAHLGEENKAATELGVANFNTRMAALGHDVTLTLVPKDNESNSQTSLTRIQELYNEGVEFVIGPLGSSGTTAVKDFANENEMLVISCCSTAPALAIPGDSIFRLLPDDTNQGPAITRLALDEGRDVLVPVQLDDPWGNGLAETVMNSYTDNGKTFATPIKYDPPPSDGTVDYSDVAASLAESVQHHINAHDENSVAVLAIGFGEIAEIMKAASAHDILDDVLWIGADGIAKDIGIVDDADVLAFAQSVNFVAISPSTQSSPVTEEVLNHVTSTVNRSPNPYIYSSYDAAWLIGNSIVRANDNSASAIKNELINVADDYVGARGDVMLNENGDLVSTGYDLFAVRGDDWHYAGSYAADTDDISGLLPSTVKVGAMFPQGIRDTAAENLTGARLGAEDFNAYLKAKNVNWGITLVDRDTRPDSSYTSAHSATLITELHEEGINAVVGPQFSSNTGAIKEYVDNNDILVVSPSSTAVGLSIPNDNIYRITPDDFNQSKAIGQLLTTQDISVIVIAYRDDIWGQGLRTGISSEFTALGGHVHDTVISYDPTSDDYVDSLLNQLNAGVAEALLSTSGNVAVMFIGFSEINDVMDGASNMNHSRLNDVRWFGTDANLGSPEISSISFATDVGFTAVQATFAPTPLSENIKTRIQTALGGSGQSTSEPNTYAYSAYEAAWLIGLAIEAAGSAEGKDIVERFGDAVDRRNAMTNIFGTITLNQSGDLTGINYAISQVQNGQWERIGTYDDSMQNIEFENITITTPIIESVGSPTNIGDTKVGLLLPLTGSNAHLGEENKAATELGVANFNTRMAALGHDVTLTLVPKDNESNSQTSLTRIQELYNEGVEFVIGPLGSSGTTAVKDFANENEMLVISCCSTAPALAIPGDSIFRLLPDDTNQGPAITRLALDEGRDVLVPVQLDDPWGNGLAETVMNSYTDNGKTFATPIKYDPPPSDGTVDYSDVAASLAESVQQHINAHDENSVAVLAIGFGEIAEIMKAASAHDILDDVLWIGADGIAKDIGIVDDADVLAFAQSVNFVAISPSTQSSPVTEEVLNHVTSTVNRSPNPYIYSSYDAAWLIGNSIVRANDNSASAIKNELINVADDYVGARGDVMLNENGDLVSTGYDLFAVRGDDWHYAGSYAADTDDISGLLPSTVKVGAMFPQGIRDTAAENLTGARLGAEDFNAYLKAKNVNWGITLVDRDTRPDSSYTSAHSATLITELHEEGINAVVGPQFSSNTGAIKEYVDNNDILVVSPSSTAVGLSIPNDNIYRITPDDFNQSKAIGQLLTTQDISVIVIAYRDDIWGQGLRTGISSEFTALGGHVHDTVISYDPTSDDYVDSLLNQLNAGVAEALLSTSGNVAVMFIGFSEINDVMDGASNMNHSRLNDVRWFGTDANLGSPEISSISFATDVGFTAVQATFAPTPLSENIKTRIQTALGGSGQSTSEPNTYAYSAYEAAWLIGLAIEAAGSAEGKDIVERFGDAVDRRNAMTNIFGTITLNQSGDLTGINYAISQVQNGQWERIGTYDDSTRHVILQD